MADKKISALTAATTPLAGTEVLPIVQSGATVKVSVANLTAGRAVGMAGGSFTDNLTQSTAAKGINFTANTAAAGMTSQLLNWYEAGTWTASLVSNGGTNPTNPVTATGYYTRIGRQVSFQVFFANVDTTGASGALKITGLPYTPAYTTAAVCGPFNFDLNGGTSVFASVESSGIFPLVATDDAGWVELQFGAGVGRYLHINGSYIV